MALEALWRSDLDKEGQVFTSKAEADKHDKKLDLAHSLSDLIENWFPGKFNEEDVETLTLKMADHREDLSKAFKSKTDIIQEMIEAHEPPAVAEVKSGKAGKSKVA